MKELKAYIMPNAAEMGKSNRNSSSSYGATEDFDREYDQDAEEVYDGAMAQQWVS